ncbi:MAG: c-type cytochrome [Burkholderiaceae bacterium]
MSSCRKVALGVAALFCVAAAQAQSVPYPGLGRAATPKEITAWDIDVRPDFKGLPKGSGSVEQGMEVWESKCSSCHGIFGESNEFFSPIVGGTTKEDVQTGRVARLNDRSYPSRTTLMKVSTLSTLWDYIHRAMPWTAPKSLTPNEVFGVTAYILNMGGVLPNDFTLSDQNIAEVQKLMPNRNGMTTEHAMWPGPAFGNRKPDVQATACMKDCSTEPTVSSFLPDFARNAHGNLAEQNRLVGAQHGADTSKPPPASLQASAARQVAVATGATTQTPAAATTTTAADAGAAAAIALAQKHSCTACHGVENKIIGPAFRDIAKKHASRDDVVTYLTTKIKAGGSGVWGAMPMPPQTLPEEDAKAIAQWLANGAPK